MTQLARARLLIALTMVEALTFLVLVSLFALTGSRAPTAIINNDHGPLATSFIAHLNAAHHSFRLIPMTEKQARSRLSDGDLVASITIPAGFSQQVAAGQTVALPVVIDNVDADLTDDIERAVPSAITTFGRDHHFNGIRVVASERDLVDHDTSYISYLVVSALALDALVVAGILGAVAMTREWEHRTIKQIRLAPVAPGYMLAGKLVASATVSSVAVVFGAAVVMALYGIAPVSVVATLLGLVLCVVIFTCVGACVGALVRHTLPVAPLFFGLALPLYIDSGALEPERFDGNLIWGIAHASPVYYAVGVLERAVHGLRVTPEPVAADVGILVLWAALAVAAAALTLSRRAIRQ